MEQFEIVVSSKAQQDFSECVSFVLNVSVDAAKQLVDDIYNSIGSLKTFPERNPVFEMPKSFPYILRKQIINGRYIALYSIEEKKVIIYRLLDSRRKFDYLVK